MSLHWNYTVYLLFVVIFNYRLLFNLLVFVLLVFNAPYACPRLLGVFFWFCEQRREVLLNILGSHASKTRKFIVLDCLGQCWD